MQFEIIGNDIHTLSSHTLRYSEFIQPLALYVRDRPGSAEQKIGWAIARINSWAHAEKDILTPDKRRLVMVPQLSEIDGHVHAHDKRPVFRELKHFRLLDPAEAFKEDGKRTMNRFLKKADAKMGQQLDIRSLSMVFWLAVARVVEEGAN